MNTLKVYTKQDILSHTRIRSGEEKLGEKIFTPEGDWQTALRTSNVKFVIIGIPEDIGVRANHGRPGAATAFKPAVDSFLNQQTNGFMDPETMCVLGEIQLDDLMEQAAALDPSDKDQMFQLRALVSKVDERVSEVVKEIVGMNKIPILIGGGHNNSYGNLKGSALALGRKVAAINCDPHLDFRAAEGRHSGNGFSYAYNEGYLGRYAVFAMHEQYNNQASLSAFRQHPEDLFFNTYESVFVRAEKDFLKAVGDCVGFVNDHPCGIEIDLDAITNVPASAKTSSGISPLQARQFIHYCASNLLPVYLHIAEAAPVLSHIKADNKTGKLISYLVTDFIKAVRSS